LINFRKEQLVIVCQQLTFQNSSWLSPAAHYLSKRAVISSATNQLSKREVGSHLPQINLPKEQLVIVLSLIQLSKEQLVIVCH
jgi:hypothetical protein